MVPAAAISTLYGRLHGYVKVTSRTPRSANVDARHLDGQVWSYGIAISRSRLRSNKLWILPVWLYNVYCVIPVEGAITPHLPTIGHNPTPSAPQAALPNNIPFLPVHLAHHSEHIPTRRKLLDIFHLDFKKAFDSLVHSKFIAKIASYEVNYELLSWIQAFLTGRSQRVVIDNVLSNPIAVGSGVAQGSVLGPLIFILFINDIVDCLNTEEVIPTTCCIFVDDMRQPMRQPRIAHHCPTPLRTSKAGPIKWQPLINAEKNLLMHFGSGKHDRPMYFICDKLFAPSDLIRVGITYDSKLCSMTTSTKLSVEHINGLIGCFAHLFLKMFQF